MIRLLIFFLWVVFFSAVVTVLLLSFGGTLSIEAFGWRFDPPIGAAIIFSLLATIAFALLISTAKDLINAPKRARARAEIRRRETGLDAITNGLRAIAAGDATGAKKHARIAKKSLPEAPVAKLLAAQAAQLSGDDAAAGEALAGLLEAPETEFLALRGLFAKARRDGDLSGAALHARRAFKLHPSALWAFEGVFDAALENSDWDEALLAVQRAASAGAIEKPKAVRGEAALLIAHAYNLASRDEKVAALQKAEAALRLAPGFEPAAVLAARLDLEDGHPKKAEKTLLAAFAARPTRAVVEALLEISKDDRSGQAERLERIAAKSPASREGIMAAARARLLANEPEQAIEILKPLAEASLTADVAALMAEAVAAHQGPLASYPLLQRAASAPREDAAHAEWFSRLDHAGWRRLVVEFMETGRLAPLPFEGAPLGVAHEDLVRLAAPEPAAAPEISTATEAAGIEQELIADQPSVALEATQDESADASNADETIETDAAAARSVN